MIFLDTHAVIWLYEGDLTRLSEKAKLLIENQECFVSPTVKLELQYLFEIDRISRRGAEVLQALTADLGLIEHSLPLASVMDAALKESWTRDPFDRLITSHAKLKKAPLVTKDQTILEHYEKAIW